MVAVKYKAMNHSRIAKFHLIFSARVPILKLELADGTDIDVQFNTVNTIGSSLYIKFRVHGDPRVGALIGWLKDSLTRTEMKIQSVFSTCQCVFLVLRFLHRAMIGAKTAVIAGCAGAAAALYLYSKLVSLKNSDVGVNSDGFNFQCVLRVPRGSLGMIIGRQERNAVSIYKEHGVSLRSYANGYRDIAGNESRENVIDYHDEEEDKQDGSPSDFLKIVAPTKEKMDLVLLQIKGTIMLWKNSRSMERIRIPVEAVGYVIGKHGKHFKKISFQCRVRTFIVESEADHEVMEIRGSEECITAAVDKIQESVARYMMKYGNPLTQDVTGRSGLDDSVTDEIRDMAMLKELLGAEEEPW